MSRRAQAVGFRTLSTVHAGPWALQIAGRESEDGADVAGWDPELGIRVSRQLEVDMAAVLEEIDHGPAARLDALIVWHASGSGLRGAGTPVPLANGVVELAVDLPGAELGGVLSVESAVILRRADALSELAARDEGTVLWRDSTRYQLEGDGSRLQTRTVPFSEHGGYPKGALWCWQIVEADYDDLAAPQVTLFLNTEHAVIDRLVSAEMLDPMLVALLRMDVERQLVEHALDRDDELDMSRSFDEASFGELLKQAVDRNFPGRTIGELRDLRHYDRGAFEATFQETTRFMQ